MKTMLAVLFGLLSHLHQCEAGAKNISAEKITSFAATGLESIAVGDVLERPASKICSFGPYDDVFVLENYVDESVLTELDILPVPEGYGYFVYLDKVGKIIGHDRFPTNLGPVRWKRDRKGDIQYCFDSSYARLNLHTDDDTLFISISENR